MLVGFDLRIRDFVFNIFDVGRYCPPLHLPSVYGRWKAKEWHHLAAVWDRYQGIKVYEDGQLVDDNWGEYRWHWSLIPQTMTFSGVVDEVYIFDVPLTDEQIAQLARGEKPTGDPAPAASEAVQRAHDLAAWGWTADQFPELPVVEAEQPAEFAFARFIKCVDAKRPVAQLFEGFSRTTWPLIKYGASIRGRHLDIELAPGQTYDRVRAFVHRRFVGRFMRLDEKGAAQEIIPFNAPHATIWHRRLPEAMSESRLILKRTTGQLGQIDFYRVTPLAEQPQTLPEFSFSLAQADAFPDAELGLVYRSETPKRFQKPVSMQPEPVETWRLDAPAFGGFQAFSDEPGDSFTFDGALVTLVADGLAGPTPVRVEIKEPVNEMRDWLVADAVLKPTGPGRQVFTLRLKGRAVINFPHMEKRKYWKDGQYLDETEPVPAPRFGLKVTAGEPVRWVMGRDGCTFALCVADEIQALSPAVEDQVEFMREAYAELMEGHHYSDPRLVRSLRWLTLFAPYHEKTRQMYERVGSPLYYVDIAVPKLRYTPPKNETGAPDWAFWQMEAMKEHLRLIHWRIDNQQLTNGEYGGVWNDDTTHVENWYGYALCMDDSGKIKDSLRLFYDGLERHLDENVCKYTQDLGHFYEDGMGSMSMGLLIDYGDPTAFNRALVAASHYDKWLVQKGNRYVVRSGWLSGNLTWDTFGMIDFENSGGALLIPASYLVWYNRHPTAMQYLCGWEGNGGGLIGVATDIANGMTDAERRAQYEELLLRPLGRYGAIEPNEWLDEVGVTEKVRQAHAYNFEAPGTLEHYWGAKDTGIHWFKWRTTGDIRYLVESYKRVCEWAYSHDWLNTAAMASMDRNPLPRWALIRSRMGALASNRGTSSPRWPYHAISYVKGANDVAALVTENLDTRFTVRFYPFTDAPHEVQLRVWRLHPGLYKVALAEDLDDDGTPDGPPFMEKQMDLQRGAYVDLILPARKPSILTVTPIKTTPPDFDKPDPAIGPRTVEMVYFDHFVVRVYNLGNQPVRNLLVRVTDRRSGRRIVMGEQRIELIEPPLDFKPKHRTVEFKNFNAHTYDGVIVEIDPEHEIDDLNPFNNRVEFRY